MQTRLAILVLLLLPAGSALKSETSTEKLIAQANQHFARAEAVTDAKGMHQFTKEEFDALLSEYEAGLEILIASAERAPQKEALDLAGKAAYRLREYANHALRRYKYDRVFEYWDRIRKVNKQAPVEAVFASAMALQAHGALGEEDYEEAIRIFGDMTSIANSGSMGKLVMESYHPEFYEKIARRARELSEHPVTPEYTVKVFSPRIGLLRFKWTHRLLNGATQEVKNFRHEAEEGRCGTGRPGRELTAPHGPCNERRKTRHCV